MAHIHVIFLTATHHSVCLTTCSLRKTFSKSLVLHSACFLQFTLWVGVSYQSTYTYNILLQTMRNKLKSSGHYSLAYFSLKVMHNCGNRILRRPPLEPNQWGPTGVNNLVEWRQCQLPGTRADGKGTNWFVNCDFVNKKWYEENSPKIKI
jgi:hypothetical protein